MSTIRSNRLLAGSLVAMFAGSLAFAQEPETSGAAEAGQKEDAASIADTRPIDEIIVIGSNIRGIAVGPSPVIAFDKQDIELTGVATLQQFFEKLPQNFGGGANGANVGNLGVDRDTGNNFGQGTSINLRGLGTGTTLTLINGHRVSSSNRYQYVDISLIPLSAVDRVEILTDGASAIYGADAIGGVVNIVMRQDFTGYETGLRFGSVTEGGMQEYQFSQAAGWSWDGGRALVSYEFLEQENLSAFDKDFSSNVPFDRLDLYPASTRHSVYIDGLQQINDVLSLNLAGSFSRREMDTTISSPFEDFTNLFPQNQQFDLYAGLTADLPGRWRARLNAGYGENDVRYERTTVEDGMPDTAPPTDQDSSIGYLDFIADGNVFMLPAGAVLAAVGASYRREEYDFFDFREQEDPLNPSRDIVSAFGELSIPLLNDLPGVRNLSLTVAARYDDYSDFGSTTNPKYGFVWEAADGLTFRASYGESFRAPVFEELQANNFAFVTSVPNPDAADGSTNLILIANGNPDLGPERAETWSGGFSFEPRTMPGLTVQANYYQIDFTDRIDAGYPGSVFAFFSQSTEPYAELLTFNPTTQQIDEAVQLGLSGTGLFVFPADLDPQDTEVILDNRVRNVALTAQEGLDLNASYSFDSGDTRIDLSLAGQYIIDSTRQVTSAAPESEVINVVFLPVDLKMRGGMALTRRNLSGGLFVNYVDSYRDPSNLTDPKVDSWTHVDLNLKYRFNSGAGSAGGTILTLNIQNLFDSDPPFIENRLGTGFDPTNATPLGRFASLSLTHQW